MNVNPLFMSLESPMGVPVFPDYAVNTGLDKYITFNYVSERSDFFADNEPVSEETEIQLHYFMRNCNVQKEKRKLRKCLHQLDISHHVGAEIYENDTKYNHIVIICTISGEPDYL